jgi:hypothetical protein
MLNSAFHQISVEGGSNGFADVAHLSRVKPGSTMYVMWLGRNEGSRLK